MAIELRQQLKLTQQLIMTPQLQMAIKLLQLSRLELVDAIRQELEDNPTLEEIQDVADVAREGEEAEAASVSSSEDAREVTIEEKISDDIDWSNYLDEYNAPGKVTFESEAREAPQYEAFVSAKESLTDHLLRQLSLISPTDLEKRVGSLIIGNLNADGYLQVSVEEIAEQSGESIEMVEDVLETLQSFDPAGVCARDLRECLLIQTRLLGIEDSLVTNIISHHLKNLENKNFKAICKALKAKEKHVIAAISVIRALEPKPGREFSEEAPHYIIPDIYVYKTEDDFVIVLNDDGMPKLRLNSFYKQAIARQSDAAATTKDYIRDKMRSATWLIRSIHQRQKTIYRVMESILKFQRAFFEKGIDHLKPMVLRDVAEDIDMHESTISRVTTNKYVHTPQGIFELKYFFNSSIKRMHGDDIASTSVQAKIKKLVESEDPKNPYSDDQMVTLLKADNIDIARRTIAKYREMMGILSSSKRKQF
ncbi:RNA polymerase factor sigma-54 [Desulfosarcina sp. OttesenSCG-928-G10]|nr:RNA polymerase factor sigma-54 [Desulfosarcina sp. OttesenSCG-928-G10]MDL2321095.1 RNA polymerase factor sigma-54 [Desulfosarcina sp. OttesenSCG-928-B08]